MRKKEKNEKKIYKNTGIQSPEIKTIEKLVEKSALVILKLDPKNLEIVDIIGDSENLFGIKKEDLIKNQEFFYKNVLPPLLKETLYWRIFNKFYKDTPPVSKVITLFGEKEIKKLRATTYVEEDFILIFFVDVSNEWKLIDELRYQTNFLDSLLNSIPQGIILVDSKTLKIIKYKSNIFMDEICRAMGLRENVSLMEIFPSSKLNAIKYNIDYVSRIGEIRNILLDIEMEETKKNLQLCFSKVSKNVVLIVVNDITEFIELKEKYEYLSLHDPLTDLPNRRYIIQQLKQLAIQASRHNRKLGVLFLDIDNFKDINDSYGHSVGDKLLKAVAQRVIYSLRPGDIVGRMAGDEFIIVLDDVAKVEDIQLVCNKILRSIEKIKIDDIEISISVSIGISIYPDDSENIEELIKFADIAMYKSKEKGKGTFEFYSKDMAEKFKHRIEMINKIQEAIKNQEFTVFYQPIIDIKNLNNLENEQELRQEIIKGNLIFGLEALIRWFKDGKMIPPLDFIPLAEETNLIVPIGKLVLDLATKQLYKFKKSLFVNVSAKEFEYPLYFEDLLKILTKNSFDPKLLNIEITEGLIIKNMEKFLNVSNNLRGMGIGICIDDFGVGYSSLSSLVNIPAKVIKIDRSFIARIVNDEKLKKITKTIIDISKVMGFLVVAEGIETIEQLKIVKEQGCDFAQGFLFFKPMPIEEIEKILRL